ncbi:T9SS type A sorting domain-containing protein [Flavobacterium sp.]|uniref:T9SS type A sorting domain-containing protein n=1 Tax=Flavobacterium sp. TaxID=239 RepID=UPI00286D086E|nr:T9SS type A sorting domain-containing protein [Flavobacterium sp.]
MKKTTLRILFCLFITTMMHAQTANYDNYVICAGSFDPIRPLGNDDVPAVRSIDFTSLDLDQTLAGIQSSVIIGSVQFNADATGEVTWTGFAFAEAFNIAYTFMDDLGNLSNEGTLRIYFAPPALVSDQFFSDYHAGDTTPAFFGMETVGYLSTVYPGFTMITDGAVTIAPGTPPGNYVLQYYGFSTSCPTPVYNATITIEVTPALGLISVGTDDDISVGPNPTNGIVSIKANTAITQIEMYDLNGRMILSSTENAQNVTLNIELFANGIYMLKIATSKTNSTYKLIKK